MTRRSARCCSCCSKWKAIASAAAPDGKSALELVALGAVRPDIVVADYNLPNGLSGLEVASRLRGTFDRTLPVLIVTGDISTDTLRAISLAGCVQLNKPIKAEDLTRLVRSQLAAPRQKPEPAPETATGCWPPPTSLPRPSS